MLTVALLTPAEVELLRLAASGVTLDTIAHQLTENRQMTQLVSDQISAANVAEQGMNARITDIQTRLTDVMQKFAADELDKSALLAEVGKLTSDMQAAASSGSASTPATPAPVPPADTPPAPVVTPPVVTPPAPPPPVSPAPVEPVTPITPAPTAPGDVSASDAPRNS